MTHDPTDPTDPNDPGQPRSELQIVSRPPPSPLVEPFSVDELRRLLVRPDLLLSCLLGAPRRLGRTVAVPGRALVLLPGLFLAAALAGVPYGAAAPSSDPWSVTLLFAGSVLICVPCLHVFLVFLGRPGGLHQHVSLGLLVAATAALFSLGFAPIIWFIDLTTDPQAVSLVSTRGLSLCLLTLALALGVTQLGRCLNGVERDDAEELRTGAPLLLWVCLLVFIVWRMAGVVGLRG